MRAAHAAERAERRSEIVVVASREDSAAAFVKARDAFAIGLRQTVSGVDREEPELVEVRGIERAQHRIVARSVFLTIPRRDLVTRSSLLVFDRTEMIPQQRKPVDVPIVFDRRDSSLQKYLYRIVHLGTVYL